MKSSFLALDQGNTSLKAFLIGRQIQKLSDDELKTQLEKKTSGLITSVKRQNQFSHLLQVHTLFKKKSFLQMPVNYNETLGVDRLVTAYQCFNKKNTSLIIDAGSFTTIDLVTANGFQGGIILPGIDLLKRTYQNGDKLQDFTPQLVDISNFTLPDESYEAINLGLSLSFLKPIYLMIENHPHANVIITGGAGIHIKHRKASYDPLLMAKGLKRVYQEVCS